MWRCFHCASLLEDLHLFTSCSPDKKRAPCPSAPPPSPAVARSAPSRALFPTAECAAPACLPQQCAVTSSAPLSLCRLLSILACLCSLRSHRLVQSRCHTDDPPPCLPPSPSAPLFRSHPSIPVLPGMSHCRKPMGPAGARILIKWTCEPCNPSLLPSVPHPSLHENVTLSLSRCSQAESVRMTQVFCNYWFSLASTHLTRQTNENPVFLLAVLVCSIWP